MKYDCNKTLDFIQEFKRMCKSHKDCFDCEFSKVCDDGECMLSLVKEKQIKDLQQWSDEHQEKTMKEKFYEMFPNAPKSIEGCPVMCPRYIGWDFGEVCPVNEKGERLTCSECWDRPYKEEE